jgi:hypothetical protein
MQFMAVYRKIFEKPVSFSVCRKNRRNALENRCSGKNPEYGFCPIPAKSPE